MAAPSPLLNVFCNHPSGDLDAERWNIGGDQIADPFGCGIEMEDILHDADQ
jgi:hypothetical protein